MFCTKLLERLYSSGSQRKQRDIAYRTKNHSKSIVRNLLEHHREENCPPPPPTFFLEKFEFSRMTLYEAQLQEHCDNMCTCFVFGFGSGGPSLSAVGFFLSFSANSFLGTGLITLITPSAITQVIVKVN